MGRHWHQCSVCVVIFWTFYWLAFWRSVCGVFEVAKLCFYFIRAAWLCVCRCNVAVFCQRSFSLPASAVVVGVLWGWAILPLGEYSRERRWAFGVVSVGCLLGAICVYGDIFDSRSDASFIQDKLLLASASSRIGQGL